MTREEALVYELQQKIEDMQKEIIELRSRIEKIESNVSERKDKRVQGKSEK